jgi:hypothetical protein
LQLKNEPKKEIVQQMHFVAYTNGQQNGREKEGIFPFVISW